MTKFLIKIALFITLFFFVEKIFYVFLHISPNLEADKRLEKLITGKINKDIIILGSSRGARNVISSQIEDSLHLSAYNLSYPGSDVEFHEFILRTLLKFNKPPKILILVVDDPSELLVAETINFRNDVLYPLSKYNYINNELIKRGEKNYLSHFLILSRINKMNFNLSYKKFSELDSVGVDGSMPISFQKQNVKFRFNNRTSKYSSMEELPEKISAYSKIQDLCELTNTKLIVAFPPNFQNHDILFEERLKVLANPGVSFYVYDQSEKRYRDNSYYYDVSHLQKKGAIIFTGELILRIKNQFNFTKI